MANMQNISTNLALAKGRIEDADFAAETANTCDSSCGAASATVDWNASQKQKLTITGTSNTINFTNPAGPCNLQLKIVFLEFFEI